MKTILDKLQALAPIVATVICIGLAVLMWLPLQQISSQDVTPVAQAASETRADPSIALLADGAESLVERPLFHVTRRQPQAQEVVQAAPVRETLFLTGVVNNGDVDIALLRLSTRQEPLRGRVGDNIGDWQILDITNTAIKVLNPEGEEQIIGLSSANN